MTSHVEGYLCRVAHYILFSSRDYVKLKEILECFQQPDLSEDDHINILMTDGQSRFKVEDVDGAKMIGLTEMTEADRMIRDGGEEWRSAIWTYLEGNISPFELGRLPTIVRRPASVPKVVKITDLLRADIQNRFRIFGPHNNVQIARSNLSSSEEIFKEAWRQDVFSFLSSQEKNCSLSEVEAHVVMPIELKTGTQLFEILRTDQKARFMLHVNDSGKETLVGLSSTNDSTLVLSEKWRVEIAKYLASGTKATFLSDLGSVCPRPAFHPRNISLQEVLMQDPLHRFRIVGKTTYMKAELVGHGTASERAVKANFLDKEKDKDNFKEKGLKLLSSSPSTSTTTQETHVDLKDWTAGSSASASVPATIGKLSTKKGSSVLVSSQLPLDNKPSSLNQNNKDDAAQRLQGQIVETYMTRICYYILFAAREYVPFSEIVECFLSDVSEVDLMTILQSDSRRRVQFADHEGHLGVGLVSISEGDKTIRKGAEEWRLAIAKFLESHGGPVELGRLTTITRRPNTIPRAVKIMDLLKSDLYNRFEVFGPPNNVQVARGMTVAEDETLREQWRQSIYDTLLSSGAKDRKSFSLCDIINMVTKPRGLSPKLRLLELLKSDNKGRFLMLTNGITGETQVNILQTPKPNHPNEAMPTDLISTLSEKWRHEIVKYLMSKKKAVYLADVGSVCQRPVGHPRTVPLQDVLTQDPLQRFKIIGKSTYIMVELVHSKVSNPSPPTRVEGVGKASKGALALDTKDQSKNTKKQLGNVTGSSVDGLPGGGVGSSTTFKSLKASMNGLYSSSNTSPANNSVSLSSTNQAFGSWSPFFMDSPHRSSLDILGTSPGNSRSLLHSGFESFHSSIDDLLSDSKDVTSSSHELGLDNNTASYHVASLSSLSDVNSSSSMATITPPFPPPLSPLKARAIPSNPLAKQTLLKDWLPGIFEGYSETLVSSFCDQLCEEGFINVEDLIIAQAMDQLTFEYLKPIGFKMGHFNRLVAKLSSFSDSS